MPRFPSLATVLLGTAALTGCTHSDDAPRDAATADTLRLTGEVVTESEALGRPSKLALVGDRLVVLDRMGTAPILVFDVRDGRLVRSIGRKGSGPGEFRSPWSVDPVAGSRSEAWVFDAQLVRFSHLDLDRDSMAVDSLISFTADGRPTAPVWVNDTLLVSPGFFTHGRLGRFHRSGRMLGTVGELPADDKAPPQVVQHAYQSYLVARPDRSRFALLTRHADRAEIYGADGRTVAVVPGPLGFTPVYEVRVVGGGASMVSGEDLRFGYIDAAATDERIYGLFSGRTRRDCPGCASLGTRLRVLDWNGRVTGTFRLDAYLLGIAVSPDGRTVYGARVEPTPAILRYRLPEVP